DRGAAALDDRERTRRPSRDLGTPGVDLVRRELAPRRAAEEARRGDAGPHAHGRLLAREGRGDRQEAEPDRGRALGLDPLGIAQALAEHLETAADAEDGPARRGRADDGRGEPGLLEPDEIR